MQFQSAGKTPAAHAEHAHRFSFFFGNVLGPNGTAALEGANGSPLLTTSGGSTTPQIYYIYLLSPIDHFPPLDRTNIPF